MIRNKGVEKNVFLKPAAYIIFSMLLFSWPYRLWVEMKTEHKEIDIMKKIGGESNTGINVTPTGQVTIDM